METKTNQEQRVSWLEKHRRFMGTRQLAADHPRKEIETKDETKIPA